jgi:pimeloyl-ACP methyl ester carboxylesterase
MRNLICLLLLELLMGSVAARAHSVAEEKYVRIGGIDQWITIKGVDQRNPVVLFLHGGPGDAISPYADAIFAGWDRQLTVVQWDQRGAGRTFGKSGPSIEPTMTLDRMVQDGIEVAEYLTKRLGKKRLILVGGSWGSILGIYMVKQRPELFYAYVGFAQVVNMRDNQSSTYAHLLELARSNNDDEVRESLEKLGPPPWDSLRKWPVFHKALIFEQNKRVTSQPPASTVAAEYASADERSKNREADDFSFVHFFGMALSGPIEHVDLPALGLNFAVPIYVVQGAEDLTTLPELAKTYFDSIEAPHKKFILVPGTGHEPSAAEIDVIRNLIVEEIRPHALR